MAEENQTTNKENTKPQTEAVGGEISSTIDNKDAKEEATIKEPSLEEDYEALKHMNLLRNVMVRLQYGRFPNAETEAILKRRMNFDESKFQGAYVARVIISILTLFFLCTLTYIVIWLATSSMNLNGIRESASLIISLFFFSGCGFVIFNSLSSPDEKKLKLAIKERMTELEIELNLEKNKNNGDHNRTGN